MNIPNEIAKKAITSKYIITLHDIEVNQESEDGFCDMAEIEYAFEAEYNKLMKKVVKEYNNIINKYWSGAIYATGRAGFFIGNQEVY